MWTVAIAADTPTRSTADGARAIGMTVITRKHTGNFAMVPNEVAEDARLSFEARGLLIYLLAKPNDWQVQIEDIRRAGRIGRDKAYRLLKELKSVGYIELDEERDPVTKRVTEYNYIIYDLAMSGSLPFPEKPEAAHPVPENPEAGRPLPEKPLPAQPDTAKPDGLIRNKSTKTHSYSGAFGELCNAWKGKLPDSLDKVERMFVNLPAEIDRTIAVQQSPAYLRMMLLRQKAANLFTYVRDRAWKELIDAPALDKDGEFVITRDREEWEAWLDDIRARHGDVGVHSANRDGRIVRPHRWPPNAQRQLAMVMQ